MRRRPMHMSDEALDALGPALVELRAELKIPLAFPKRVLKAADKAVAETQLHHEDATHLPFFTIDPSTSKDLDQAMHLERRAGGGFRVYYAIADVAAFVRSGSPLDAEAHDRIETLYFPDLKVPLHPPVLSEDAVSLLPGKPRPALLWRHDLDAAGNVTESSVSRAMVCSRAKLSYQYVQQAIDNGTAEESLTLLREIGELLEAVEIKRGGISVNLPDQEVTFQDGAFRLSYVTMLPVEGWNEQISLMTGMAAAQIMIDSGTGILRTQKKQSDQVVGRLHEIAKCLGIDWDLGVPYATLVRTLDPTKHEHMAFLTEATTAMPRAEYTVFRDHQTPEHTKHETIAAPYAHCTAPLRRLVDRYTGELCVAACADKPPPKWVLDALHCLPCDMARAKGGVADRQTVDLAEAMALRHREGEVFDAAVIDTDAERNDPLSGKVYLAEPAVLAKITSTNGEKLRLGARVRARLKRADPSSDDDKVLFNVP
ncbi:ribonuclease II [Streptomyces sp. WM6373]|uniref:RNB domain-containing ribonuclease n=1 Tax=Streptomyces TaxID=1883 RepID=UPI0006AE848E|nr:MULTISPECIES: RNB domain-containing ribonuclease [unclassified Streptomyces]KOU33808.1 ribonuclease II [Streptomyces sp. WM6373]KOU58392.1 ribonuclease II [Streptomyces sp. IGB124]KOU90037.1 ribonuclease II [Streptomyces sp. XY58]KOV12754.1 ribonuclease II [Streptomyces sp. XY37]KOV56693.1 ribonuclease II [Streptomyces sp. MMG1064]